MKRRTALKTIGSAFTVGIAGCTSSQNQSDAELGTLDALVEFWPDMVNSPPQYALENGFFEENGLNVNWDWNLEASGLQLLAQGEIDLLAVNTPAYPIAEAQGIDLVPTHTTVADTGLSIASLPETGISSAEDLIGNTLGRQSLPDRNWYLPAFYDEAGLSDDQIDGIEETNIGFSLTNVLEGVVDAQTLYPTNTDFNSLEVAGEGLDAIELRDILDVHGTMYVTTADIAEERHDAIREWVRGNARAIEDSLSDANREQYIDIVIDALEEVDADIFLGDIDPREAQRVNYETFKSFRPQSEWDSNGIGWTDPERVASTIDLGVEYGDSAIADEFEEYNIDDYVDNRWINEVTDSNGNLEY